MRDLRARRLLPTIAIAAFGLAVLMPAPMPGAQEHPKSGEQPAGDKSKGEHPKEPPSAEHPTGAKVTQDDLAAAIESYVKRDAALKGGYFLVYDPVAKQPLALTLVRVHKDRLSQVGDGTYFACADFRTPTDKTYDLDVFMRGPDKDHLTATEVTVHKVNGKERYTWYEEDGLWKRKMI
jgi:hypothetical protein